MQDYSTDSFRGNPYKIFSDLVSQLQGVSNTLKGAMHDLNETQLKDFGLKYDLNIRGKMVVRKH